MNPGGSRRLAPAGPPYSGDVGYRGPPAMKFTGYGALVGLGYGTIQVALGERFGPLVVCVVLGGALGALADGFAFLLRLLARAVSLGQGGAERHRDPVSE